jgi:hypothetical protein
MITKWDTNQCPWPLDNEVANGRQVILQTQPQLPGPVCQEVFADNGIWDAGQQSQT